MKINRNIAVLVVIVILFAFCLTACGGGSTGTVKSVYQKLVNGPVHTYLSVQMEDGDTVEVRLPDDDAVWNTARNSVGDKVKIKKSGDTWTFVDFVD